MYRLISIPFIIQYSIKRIRNKIENYSYIHLWWRALNMLFKTRIDQLIIHEIKFPNHRSIVHSQTEYIPIHFISYIYIFAFSHSIKGASVFVSMLRPIGNGNGRAKRDRDATWPYTNYKHWLNSAKYRWNCWKPFGQHQIEIDASTINIY